MHTRSKEASIRGVCTICMQRPSNCSLNGCSHYFCFRCIKKWSKTKNTCPLCRERFLHFQYKDRVIEVEDIPQRVRPQRISLQSQQTQPQTLVYLPLLIYPQNACFIYTPQSNIFIHPGVTSQQPLTFSISSPAFFRQDA